MILKKINFSILTKNTEIIFIYIFLLILISFIELLVLFFIKKIRSLMFIIFNFLSKKIYTIFSKNNLINKLNKRNNFNQFNSKKKIFFKKKLKFFKFLKIFLYFLYLFLKEIFITYEFIKNYILLKINVKKNQIFFLSKKKFRKKSEKIIKENNIILTTNFLKVEKHKNLYSKCSWEKIAYSIEHKLIEYNIRVRVKNILEGPVVVIFELELSPGTKLLQIKNLSKDLARLLLVKKIRIIENINDKPYIGIEFPKKYRRKIYLREILDSNEFQLFSSPTPLILGKNVVNKPVIDDLRKMPHLLVAGSTGSGKSMWINSMIIGILYKSKPNQVRFIMIDLKILELSNYNGIPHLLFNVISDIKEAKHVLQWCLQEMEKRYRKMSLCNVKNLEDYNKLIENIRKKNCSKYKFYKKRINKIKNLPYIIVIVDEFSDLTMSKNNGIEKLITQLIQKSRASGIHFIFSTQRPSVKVITGIIKSNIPARISFSVLSKIDSRIILDHSGAESLLGMGDMLYISPKKNFPKRIHGAYIENEEINKIVEIWKKIGVK